MKKLILERIEKLEKLEKMILELDMITQDEDEREILNDLEDSLGLLSEAKFFYNEKLDELEGTVDYIDEAVAEYESIVYERVAHKM
ncbi:hypothetical protein [Caminicella sporogenes]|uniref:hypothetical protein n=1 Tax=Caminicella sporogenes TaxID=166485 RepID=UPI00254172A2|nr:hypothetical protein [Caminicella sporogenes]WIF95050.1 hypothetical protein QNI18_12430 [Caminicella sporogenes]